MSAVQNVHMAKKYLLLYLVSFFFFNRFTPKQGRNATGTRGLQIVNVAEKTGYK